MKRIYKITGLQFQDYDKVKDSLEVGAEVQLVRMPNNQHDVNAIKVMYGEHQVGWIPRISNADLAMLLDEGRVYSAKVYSHVQKFTVSSPMGLFVEVEVL